jgi:hypothetical protein
LRHAEQQGQELHLTLGLDDRIFGNSRLILAAQLWFHRFLPVDYLRAFPDGDTVASYRRQLLSPQVENAVVTGVPPRVTTITRAKVEAAARSLGYVREKSFAMPDGRKIWIWWREGGPQLIAHVAGGADWPLAVAAGTDHNLATECSLGKGA